MMHGTQQSSLSNPFLKVENLVVEYAVGGKTIHAVSGVSLDIARGETLGLVGESGCGKSTLGRAVLQLRAAQSGRVLFDGHDLTAMHGGALRKMRRRVQLIFQDPIASLNPRRRIGDIVAEPLVIAGVKDPAKRRQLVCDVLSAVGLDPALVIGRLPHEFSGGQCQRICIARALVLNPEFIICDEPVSALDVSIRAQILNLLERNEGTLRLDAIVHRPRSRRGEGGQRSRRRDVPRPAVRGRPVRAAVRAAGASLYRALDRGDPGTGSGGASRRKRAGRRAAVADRAAFRLPFSHPLPPRGCAMCGRSAGTARGGARPVRGLSSPADLNIRTCAHFLF